MKILIKSIILSVMLGSLSIAQDVSTYQSGIISVKLDDKELDSITGDLYVSGTPLIFNISLPEIMASVKTYNQNPVITINYKKFKGRNNLNIYIVRFRPIQNIPIRRLKMGQQNLFSMSAINKPDTDWIIPTNNIEIKPGTWQLKTLKPLEYGDYAIFASIGAFGGELFDFAVRDDKAGAISPQNEWEYNMIKKYGKDYIRDTW